jgi:hypothetical protein
MREESVRVRHTAGEGFSMAEDTKAIVASIMREIARIEDEDSDAETRVVLPTGRWSPQTTRDAARSEMLWMVGQASRAAKSGQVDDARWWRDRAVSALWNMN